VIKLQVIIIYMIVDVFNNVRMDIYLIKIKTVNLVTLLLITACYVITQLNVHFVVSRHICIKDSVLALVHQMLDMLQITMFVKLVVILFRIVNCVWTTCVNNVVVVHFFTKENVLRHVLLASKQMVRMFALHILQIYYKERIKFKNSWNLIIIENEI